MPQRPSDMLSASPTAPSDTVIMIDTDQLESALRAHLEHDDDLDDRLQRSIEEVARAFGARTCTLHSADDSSVLLHLRAHLGLPPHIAEITRTIPVGKGMAGLCAERKEPVTVCNLQTDDSGVARPAAKDTHVSGALVVPVLDGDRILATLGVGMADDHDYVAEEVHALELCGRLMADALSS